MSSSRHNVFLTLIGVSSLSRTCVLRDASPPLRHSAIRRKDAMFYWRWFNRPRHPLMRTFLAAIGAMLLVGVLVFGFFALVAFAFIGSIVAIVRAIARAGAAPSH